MTWGAGCWLPACPCTGRHTRRNAVLPPRRVPAAPCGCSQTKRGGGGVVIEDPHLWRALSSLVTELEGGGPQLALVGLQPAPALAQLAAAEVHSPVQLAARTRRRAGTPASSGSGMSATTQRARPSLDGIGWRPWSSAAGAPARTADGAAGSTDDELPAELGDGCGEAGDGQLGLSPETFNGDDRAEAGNGDCKAAGGRNGDSAATCSTEGIKAAGIVNRSQDAAAAPTGSGTEVALAGAACSHAAGSQANTAADSSGGATPAKRCSCQPQNCGKGKCSCKGHMCGERCACKGLCAFTLAALQSARRDGTATPAPEMAAEEPAAAAALPAPLPAVAEGVSAVEAETSAEAPCTPEPVPAKIPPAGLETPDAPQVAAVAAGLGSLMQAAAMASALSAAAPAGRLLQGQRPAAHEQDCRDGGSSHGGSSDAGGSCSAEDSVAASRAGSATTASPGEARPCGCSPANCGRGRCGCKCRGRACTERCKCRALCNYTTALSAAGGGDADDASEAAAASAAAATAGAGAGDAEGPSRHAGPRAPAPVAALADAVQRFVQTATAAATAVSTRLSLPEDGGQSPTGHVA